MKRAFPRAFPRAFLRVFPRAFLDDQHEVPSRLRFWGLLAMLAVGSLALGGCPGTLPDDFPGLHPGGSGGAGGGGAGTGGAGAACDAPTKVFTGSCALSACHDGTFIPNLKTNPLASLRDVTAATSKVPCLGLPLLNPDMPAASVILTRISGGTCGDQMPDKLFNPNVVYLDQAGIDCVTSWVIANAKP